MTTSRPSVRMKRLTLDLPEVLHRVIKKNAAEAFRPIKQGDCPLVKKQRPRLGCRSAKVG